MLNGIHIIPLTIPVQLFQQLDFGFAEALVVLAQRTALQKFPVLKHFIDVDMRQAYDFIAVARNALDNAVRAESNQSIPDGRFADFVFLNEFLFVQNIAGLILAGDNLLKNRIVDHFFEVCVFLHGLRLPP